ncbi:SDR family oxidoreductase [Reyranella sp.]|uniref:SDR family oxidoreductase n=1 Tax=Reyranella sp. TaxID=1929291 RepID=UPI0025E7E248|nr:SDR family oxidoreductase [Reyranella sp.]
MPDTAYVQQASPAYLGDSAAVAALDEELDRHWSAIQSGREAQDVQKLAAFLAEMWDAATETSKVAEVATVIRRHPIMDVLMEDTFNKRYPFAAKFRDVCRGLEIPLAGASRRSRPRRVLVTGASRGIGAGISLALAQRGLEVAICYREKRRRAAGVASTIEALGQKCHLIEGDLSRDDEPEIVARKALDHGPIDAIVLNASGGLEAGKGLSYALALNCFAQIALVSALIPRCDDGLAIIYVTSHGAHFYPGKPVLPIYEKVAHSKQRGEQTLRRMVSLASSRRPNLRVVSGDIIEGTTTAMLLDRAVPGFVARRKRQVGRLPTIGEFSSMIAAATVEEMKGIDISTRYCGSTAPYLIPE